MKHQLSNCEIEQFSDNIYEATPKEGIVVDQKCLREWWNFYDEQREKPFGLLINSTNIFSFSREGARDMGQHPLQRKTAIFCDKSDYDSRKYFRLVLQMKEISSHSMNHKLFYDREEAIKWLSDI